MALKVGKKNWKSVSYSTFLINGLNHEALTPANTLAEQKDDNYVVLLILSG